jgi:hypothetical protein
MEGKMKEDHETKKTTFGSRMIKGPTTIGFLLK